MATVSLDKNFKIGKDKKYIKNAKEVIENCNIIKENKKIKIG